MDLNFFLIYLVLKHLMGALFLILVTFLKPDLFILYEGRRGDTNVERSYEYKEEKYSSLVADLSRHYRVL